MIDQIARAALTAVLNSLWIGVAIAAVAWTLGRFLPRSNAATRHLLWWTVLALILVLPFGGLPHRTPRVALVTAPQADIAAAPAVVVSTPAPLRAMFPLQIPAGPGIRAAIGLWLPLFDALNALIQNGDEVIVPVPYWVSFPEMVKYTGGVPVYVETHAEDGFALSAAAVEKAIGPRTRMIIVNSPGNPTGAVIPREEFERILAVCKKRGVWVLADECYSHFVYDEGKPYSVSGAVGAKPHVIVAGSLSKTFAMTGWRAGFALGPKAVIDVMSRLQSQSTSNACSITQKAALAAVTSPMDSVRAMLAEYARRREHILRGIRAIPGVTCTSPQGAFYVFPNFSKHLGKRGIPADTAGLAPQMLEHCHVALVAGEAFGAPGYVRISYATSLERIDEGLRRIERYFAAAVSAA